MCNCGDFSCSFFYADISVDQGISFFTIEMTDSSGVSTLHDNSGQGYPVADDVVVQYGASCSRASVVDSTLIRTWSLTVAVGTPRALQSSLATKGIKTNLSDRRFSTPSGSTLASLSLVVPERQAPLTSMQTFAPAIIPMTLGAQVAGSSYTLYTASYVAKDPFTSNPFDEVAAGGSVSITSAYNTWPLNSC
jgi:hypothetical protein